MGDKDFKDCLDKLVEATDSLSNMVDKMSKAVDKMIDYCVLVSLIMFIIVIIAIVF